MSTLNQSTNKRQLWFIFVRKKDELANTCLQANNNSRVSLQVCVCGDEGGGKLPTPSAMLFYINHKEYSLHGACVLFGGLFVTPKAIYYYYFFFFQMRFFLKRG